MTCSMTWARRAAGVLLSGSVVLIACSDGGGAAISLPEVPASAGDGGGPGSCADGERSGKETDVDCGGSDCLACADGKKCSESRDCSSQACEGGVCRSPSCADARRNQNESDVDCGGICGPCGDGKVCIAGTDCSSGTCADGKCVPAGCADGRKNQTETDIDCGGDSCGACADGKVCALPKDCVSGACEAGRCVSVPSLTSVSPTVGPSGGGTLITLKGTKFRAGTELRVLVGGKPATNVTWVSDTTVTALVSPAAGAYSAVDVALQNPGGKVSVLPKAFRFFLSTLAFAPPRILSFEPSTLLSAADFDGDGKVDLLELVANGVIRFRKGKGNGHFDAAVDLSAATRSYGVLRVADVNGDGKRDLVTSGNSAPGVPQTAVMLGKGDGTFAAPVSVAAVGGQLQLADTNADGKLDIVLAIGNDVSIRLGDGLGGFASPQTFNVGFPIARVHATDLNGDGKADLFVSDWSSKGRLVLSSANGHALGAEFAELQHRSAISGALSAGSTQITLMTARDTYYDSALRRYVPATFRQRVLLPSGLLSPTTNVTEAKGFGDVGLVDLDLDGNLDLVVSLATPYWWETQDPLIVVRRGRGDGTFGVDEPFPTGIQQSQLFFADIDGDGKVDVLGSGSEGLSTARNVSF
jgi:hypothetical protein